MNLEDPETLAKVIAKAIDDKELEQRGEKGDELWYAPNQQTPYTGWRLVRYENGRTMALGHCRDGELDGPSMGWSSNGCKEEESTWKDGKIMTYVVFKPNGEKCPETNVDGTGLWAPYKTFSIQADVPAEHEFPEGFSAYWVRATSSADTTATVTFRYE